MTRIVHVITGLNEGGAEAALFRLSTTRSFEEHHVISMMDEGTYGARLLSAGVPVTCLRMPRGRVTLSGLWRLWSTLRRLAPDVIQTWMYHADLIGGIVGRAAGIRNICWGIRQSTIEPGAMSRSTVTVARLCALLSNRLPRRIICCAELASRTHAELGYARERMRVIPNGYDFDRLQPDAGGRERVRAELGLDLKQRVIGFVARFDPYKDHANLLRALAALRQRDISPTCLLVGSGMDRNNAELKAMISESGLADQVLLLGSRQDIPAVMNALDLHVMSSLSEGFPNVLVEAMACGTPCVSTDVGEAAAIIGDTGFLAPPRDHVALADGIAKMLQALQTECWSTRQVAARQRVLANYSLDKIYKRYREEWLI